MEAEDLAYRKWFGRSEWNRLEHIEGLHTWLRQSKTSYL